MRPIPTRDLLYHCACGFVMGAAFAGVTDVARQVSDSIVFLGGALVLVLLAMVYLEHVPSPMARRAGSPPGRVGSEPGKDDE